MSEAITRSRQAIAEEAAAWFVEFQGRPPPRATKKRFVTWLTESPVHVEEYLAIAKVFGGLQQVDPKGEIDAGETARETVVALHAEIGDLAGEDGTGVPVSKARRARRSHRRASWMAAAALVLGLGASALYIGATGPEIYSTRLGEQRSVVLQDGSMVSLNTATRIEVAYTEGVRRVRLMHGEALFDVERDVARPFLVETRAAVVRVTGTQFNVYDKDDGTAVTVLEGRVEVVSRDVEQTLPAARQQPDASGGSAGTVARLAAGDQAVVKSGSAEIETIAIASLEPVTAWTERRLVFEATPLSEITEQFNRYNRERLVLQDSALASLELSGVFASNDPQSLVLFLERIADVEVVTSSDGREIRIRAANAAQ